MASIARLTPQLAEGFHCASTITVNSFDDDVVPNDSLTLREAIMVATGDLDLPDLTQSECGQINPATWLFAAPGTCTVTFSEEPPGPDSADTILFDAVKFPTPPGTQFIVLNTALPSLDTGNDTIDGSGVGVGLAASIRHTVVLA